jgi:hypothetical protein
VTSHGLIIEAVGHEFFPVGISTPGLVRYN